MSTRRGDQLERRYDRILRRALVASVAVHILLFLIFAGRGAPSIFSAAGPRAGDDRAAAAGGGMQVVQLLPPTPFEIIRPPEPVPAPDVTIDMVDFVPETDRVSAAELADRLGQGDREGPEEGEGIEGGEGEGDGGTSDSGRFRLLGPRPRGLILPPSDRPGKVRGKTVQISVFVSEGGRVVADSTRISPPTGDRGFDRRLIDDAAEWVFEPARRGGEVVAGWFSYQMDL
jgi:hypothetical protein